MASNDVNKSTDQDIQSSLMALKRAQVKHEAKRRNLMEELVKKTRKLEIEQAKAKRREAQVQSGQHQLRVLSEAHSKVVAHVKDQRLKQSNLIDASAAAETQIEELKRKIQNFLAEMEMERKSQEEFIKKVETSEAQSSEAVELRKLRAVNADLKQVEKETETEGSLEFEIASGKAIQRVESEKEAFLKTIAQVEEYNDELRSRLEKLQQEEEKLKEDVKVLKDQAKAKMSELHREVHRLESEEQELQKQLQVLEVGCELDDEVDGLDDDLEWEEEDSSWTID